MSLAKDLQSLRERRRFESAPNDREAYDAAVAWVLQAGLAAAALGEGELVPEFELPDAGGTSVRLETLLDREPVIVAFHLGEACPFCARTLSAWHRLLREVAAAGASFVALSPQRHARPAAKDAGAAPCVRLNDANGRVARLFGLLYDLPVEFAGFCRGIGVDPGRDYGLAGLTLPLAATYVVAADGIARYAFAHPDPARRSEPRDVLAIVRRLVASP